jgi:hypothetical protein
MRRIVRALVALALLALTLSNIARAQSFNGDIVGTLRDGSGGV